MEPKIVWESSDILVVEKPAGMLVHPTTKGEKGTLVEWLLAQYPELARVGNDAVRPGIVHRLDKDASGLLVVARTNKALHHLQQQFQAHTVLKEYLVLVHGEVQKDEGVIDLPLMRSKKGPIVARGRGHVAGGREAVTEYRVGARYRNYTLLSVQTKTGRLHQIRAHLKAIGYPVVGDRLYRAKGRQDQRLQVPRLFLHAHRLGFRDIDGEWREFNVQLPQALADYLKTLTTH